MEVLQVQLVQGSGLRLGQVGPESALDPCREGSHCDLLLEAQPCPPLTSDLTVCLSGRQQILKQLQHTHTRESGLDRVQSINLSYLKLLNHLRMTLSLFRDCISNWLSDCLLQGVTIGFCPCSSRLDSRSISFLDEESEPTQTSANLLSTEQMRSHAKP